MKFSINRGELQAALTGAARVAAGSKTNLLACAKLEAGDGLSVEAADGDRSLRVEAAALVEQGGAALVPARRLLEIVNSLPDEAVEVAASAGSASVRCGNSSFRVPALNPSDFPGFPEVEAEQTLEVPGVVFAEMAKTAVPFAAKSVDDAEIPVLAGVLVERDGDVLRMVATDSYRLCRCEFPIGEGAPFSLVFPSGFMAEAASDCCGDVSIASSGRQVRVSSGGTVMTSRLIDGKYPKWRSMMPETVASSAVFRREDVLGALRMCAAGSGGKSPVTFVYDGAVSTWSSDGEDGSAVSHAACECDGSGRVKCSIRMLESAVKACDSDEVTIGLNGPMKPIIVTGGMCRNIVMPMRD
ncbi:DNA polymerase III subunit beta [Gordonibacter massiliensis (ex Traore et al. 2017)]|uniref:DNA polymerase III subunit beta n=1 Tax=Gordonibacter massiliensis (ex Traore et al. 2017) TaxID=1841863 RepID=UPI001C8B6838|nr:DNA polymerase III subunit beta [Gordonibacter massiliensis (ex Traore et al. 2017)]MBX9032653.1 DNA polymerase III subunit beta [Gordonibacter massiliensis (ex Traore et al. 2017)]